jgi:hypothetical protein
VIKTYSHYHIDAFSPSSGGNPDANIFTVVIESDSRNQEPGADHPLNLIPSHHEYSCISLNTKAPNSKDLAANKMLKDKLEDAGIIRVSGINFNNQSPGWFGLIFTL